MANSAFTPAVLTVSGSSSTSSGEKNYVTATDGNASGLWASSTSPTVTISTSTSTIPDNITKASSLAIAWVSGTTGYARYRFTLDQADYGKKFKIQWDQVYGTAGHWTLQVWSNTASDYTGTSTQLTVQTSAVPGITGTFTTSVDMPGSTAPYIEIRIVASSTSATTIYLNSILMGPGTITQGAAVGEFETVTSYTITAATTNPTAGSGATYYRSTFRNGSYAKLRFEFNQTNAGTAGSGAYYLPLPSGLNIDFSRLAVAGSAAATNGFVGTGFLNATNNYEVNAYALPSIGTDKIGVLIQDTTTTVASWGSSTGALNTATVRLSLEVILPISQWSGSGTVSLGAGAQVEYAASTSGTWDASATAAQTVYGPRGAIISGNLGALRTKTVRFQYPIQQDDQIFVEIDPAGNGLWVPAVGSNISGTSNIGTLSLTGTGALFTSGSSVGVGWSRNPTTPTDIDVFFGTNRTATLGDTTNGWSDFSNGYWRVRKAKASSPVGFGKADSTSFGLVGPRKGQQSLTVTSTIAGWATTRAVGIYYQDQDGNHRLKFNMRGQITSTSSAIAGYVTMSGVTVKSTANFFQAFNVSTNGSSVAPVTQAITDPSNPSSNHLVLGIQAGTSVAGISISGDIELDSKPSWA